tara:strand:+ start:1 stop:813 length:813 start_codon:yes stop_codon:yes gene_type:complete
MDPRRYTVGAPQNSINPMTGQPEYFNLKKLLKFAAPFVLGPMVGGTLGKALGLSKLGLGAGATSALQSALGAAGTSALTGGKKKDILRSALLGGLGGYTFKEGAPGFMKAPEGTDLSAVKADNFLTKAIKTVAPENTFIGSKMFNLMNNPIGLAATLGITAEAFAAMSPEEKEETIRKYAFGTTDKFNPLIDFSAQKARPMNKGGATSFPRRDGGIMPSEGSGTKDDVPAMLTAGEFVLTRDAVKGLGDGNLNSGIQKAYTMMDKLERMA